MKAVRKTYMSFIYDRYQSYIRVNGKVRLIEFKKAGNNPSIKGSFTTSDPDVIKGIEEDSEFNKTFRLDKVEEANEVVKENLPLRSDPLIVKQQREEEEREEYLSEAEKAERKAQKDPVVKELPKKEVEEPVVKDVEVKETEEGSVENIIAIEEVGNVQQAKEYLKGKFPELTARQLGNKEAVLAVAKEKELIFEALN